MSWTLLLLVFSIIYSCVVTFFCIRFGILILKLQDAVEDSLTKINDNYESISAILERPLFYDSPEVRQVLQDVTDVRNSIFFIANTLSENFESDEQAEVDEG